MGRECWGRRGGIRRGQQRVIVAQNRSGWVGLCSGGRNPSRGHARRQGCLQIEDSAGLKWNVASDGLACRGDDRALAGASHYRRCWTCDGKMLCLAQAHEAELVPQVRRRAGQERRPEAGRLGDLWIRHGLQPLADASAGRRRSTETLAGQRGLPLIRLYFG